MRARIQDISNGGGGGVELLLEGGSYQFSSRKQTTTYDFPGGRSGPPAPLCFRPYQGFKQFEFTFIYLFIYSISKTYLLGLVNSQTVC